MHLHYMFPPLHWHKYIKNCPQEGKNMSTFFVNIMPVDDMVIQGARALTKIGPTLSRLHHIIKMFLLIYCFILFLSFLIFVDSELST